MKTIKLLFCIPIIFLSVNLTIKGDVPEDTTPPIFLDTHPKSWGILSNVDSLNITFNETVYEVAGGSITIYDAASHNPVSTFTFPSVQVTGSGTSTIHIYPDSPLPFGHFYVVIEYGALTDLHGNPFTGITNPGIWKLSVFEVGVIDQPVTWSDSIAIYMDITQYNQITIEPGTHVRFMGHHKIDNYSQFNAVGTPGDSIWFFADDPSTGWKGLRFYGDGNLKYCSFKDGKALSGPNQSAFGGAVFASQIFNTSIENSLFEGNHADGMGGAIHCYGSDILIRNNIFRNNHALSGGAIGMDWQAGPTLIGNLIAGNSATQNGGGMQISDDCAPVLYNNTFSQNQAAHGGAVSCLYSCVPDFYNCIFYNDQATAGGHEVSVSSGTIPHGIPDFYFCLMEGGIAGIEGAFTGDYENCLDTDPLFLQAGDRPYKLLKGSPCVNAGDPATTTAMVGNTDLAGKPRIKNNRIDMGAYETDLNVDGFPGMALKFDGEGYVDCGADASLDLTGSITVEAWIKPESMTSNSEILVKGDIHWLYWDASLEETSGHGLQINLPGPGTGWWEFHYPMEYSKWYHVAFSYTESGQLTAYVNGQIVRQAMIPGAISTNTNHLSMAATGAGTHYKGLLDEVRIWNTERTCQEIRENMYLPVPLTSSGLVSYWQCNDGQGTFLEDIAGRNKGVFHDMDDSNWTASTIPFGSGASYSQIVNSTGNYSFPGTDAVADVFQIAGQDTLVLSLIDTLPNVGPSCAEDIVAGRYWVLNSFGGHGHQASLTFTFDGEILPEDEPLPYMYTLSGRENTSDGEWDLLARASAVDAQNQTVTFDSVSASGQYCVAKNEFDRIPGTALQFNADSGFMQLANPQHFDFDTAFTVETWLMIDSVPENYYTLFSKGDSWKLEMFYASDIIVFEFSIVTANNDNLIAVGQVEPSVVKNKWTHLACVYHNGAPMSYIDIYINGAKGIQSPSESLSVNSEPFMMGADFKGLVDELRIWRTARTQQEIRENMHITLSLPQPHLVSYLQFNEGSGSVARDAYGSNFGTLMDSVAPIHWVTSTLPFGGGSSNTQAEQYGPVNFEGTGLSMDFSYYHNASITTSRITTSPVVLPQENPDIFDSQFWVVHRYGNNNYTADMTFTPNEPFRPEDASHPAKIKLYKREPTSGGDWTLLDSAASVDLTDNEVTFLSISDTGQFIIGRKKAFSGFPGHALHFDGENDRVAGSGIDTCLHAFTIEAWVKHTQLPDEVQRYITLGPEAVVLRYDGTQYGGYRELHFYIKKSNGSLHGMRVDNVLAEDEWLHVAGTYDGETMALYLNGMILGTEAVNSELYPWDGNYVLGSGGETMDGLLDEIRIWDHARTPSQIREGMHRVICVSEQGLVHYWQFNEGSGNMATDTVTGLAGTLQNMDLGNCWVGSTIPAGTGDSYTQIAQAPGRRSFPNTGMTFDISAKSGVDSITVTRVNLAPNENPSAPVTVFDDQYWVINTFGEKSLTTDLIITPAEDITSQDVIYPYAIKLFTRKSNSDGDWVLTDSAYSADMLQNEVTFKGLSQFSQFILARGTYPEEIANRALHFDGLNDYITVASDSSLDVYHFTFECWIRLYSPVGSSCIIDKGYGTQSNWYFHTSPDPYPKGARYGLYSSRYHGILTCDWFDDNWHHIAGTYNGVELILYLDGVLQESTNIPHMVVNDQNITIGAVRDGSHFFTGDLDEMRLWNYCRTEEEIRIDMHRQLDGTEENLVAYWPFNEPSGDIVIDICGGNYGLMQNMEESSRILSTAPVPFFTVQDGNWEDPATWADGQHKPVTDWSRVRINNPDTVNSSPYVIEFEVTEDGRLIIAPGHRVTVMEYED